MITSSQNPKIKRIRRLLSDRRFRQREAAFVVEGTRWLQEAGRATPEYVLASESWLQNEAHASLLEALDVPFTVAADRVLVAASATDTPSGILAVLPMVELPLPDRPSLVLVLDRIADPGNVGTILRTAAAAGVEGVLLSPGCVDPYNPKAVRATMGALLRLPVLTCSWDEIGRLTSSLSVWLAAVDGAVTYTDVDWRIPSALVIGSEANGVGPEAEALGHGRVTIPMAGQTESLNAAAAAAVLLFEAVRQRQVGR